jgi:shikimate dehydrogenase
MIKLGLIGYLSFHSLSAVIQNSALKALNIDAEYQILETEPESLVYRIKYLRSRDFLGFNVTIPLKVPITLFLTHVDAVANIAGCANTVKILPDKSMIGYNTDVYGFQKAIDDETKNLIKNSKVSVVGAGGAARACAVALAQLKVAEMDFYVRNIINALNTVNIIRDNFPDISINLKQIQNLNDLSDSKMLVIPLRLGCVGKQWTCHPLLTK